MRVIEVEYPKDCPFRIYNPASVAYLKCHVKGLICKCDDKFPMNCPLKEVKE